jgi:hypothetical protein
MEKINHAAIMWNKTKDEKYKILWYQLIKDYGKIVAVKRKTWLK